MDFFHFAIKIDDEFFNFNSRLNECVCECVFIGYFYSNDDSTNNKQKKEGDTMRAQNINLLLLFMDTIFFQDVYQHF